jgi:hypothetical protein
LIVLVDRSPAHIERVRDTIAQSLRREFAGTITDSMNLLKVNEKYRAFDRGLQELVERQRADVLHDLDPADEQP